MSVTTSARPTPLRGRLGRHGRFASAVIAALALALSGAVAANAAPTPSASISSTTATPVGQVLITMTNYLPNEPVTITLDSSPAQSYADPGYTQGVTDGSGKYTAAVFFPPTTTVGPHVLAVSSNGNAVTGTPYPFAITILPQPTGSVTPASVPDSAYLSKGVTATFTGFTPGAAVTITLGDHSAIGPVEFPVTADSGGRVSLHYLPTSGARFSMAGNYTFGASDRNSTFVARPVTLTVTADPVTPPASPAPAAPATPIQQNATFTG
ncbi:hypothetical protein [Leifsonia sp. EB34]|uniref:hypothetical protein n=1 Tax=Leifsonia sp. EB34 TaxID=3156303 RepID=UPI003519D281